MTPPLFRLELALIHPDGSARVYVDLHDDLLSLTTEEIAALYVDEAIASMCAEVRQQRAKVESA